MCFLFLTHFLLLLIFPLYTPFVVAPHFWDILFLSSGLSFPITQKSTKGALHSCDNMCDSWHFFFDFLEKVYSFYCWWHCIFLELQRKVKSQRWLGNLHAKGNQVLRGDWAKGRSLGVATVMHCGKSVEVGRKSVQVQYYFSEEHLWRSFWSAFPLRKALINIGSIQKACSFQVSALSTPIPRLLHYHIAVACERADG